MLERSRMARRLCIPLGLALGLVLASVEPGSGQERPAGGEETASALEGLVFDSTTMQPLSGARVVVMGTTVVGTSNEEGQFRLEGVPPGRHDVFFFHPRLQTLGVSAPPASVEVAAAESADVRLGIPSEATLLGAWCLAESRGAGYAPVAGVVRDTLTGVVLPQARVMIRSATPRVGRTPRLLAEGRSDESGYYRFCNVPVEEPVVAQAYFGRSPGIGVRMDLRSGEPRVQDLQVAISTVGQLQGRVVQYATEEPVAGASVHLVGTELQQITDNAGRFLLDSIPPGQHEIRTEHLGFATRTDSVTVFSNEAVLVEVGLTTEPIPLEGMIVTARGRLGEPLGELGRRQDYLHRGQIEPLLARVRDMQDLLEQGHFPALSVRETQMVDPETGAMFRGLCIESVRMQRSQETCRMIHVIVDGVPFPNPGEFLSLLPPENVESIEYLSPMDATTRFGTRAGNGALVITTRRGRR